MKFGKWNITDKTIEWSEKGQKFVIERDSLFETVGVEESDDLLYKWIVLATDEDWLAEDDLYDLNFAFVFAAGASPESFDYDTFDNTLEYQFEMLDEEDED